VKKRINFIDNTNYQDITNAVDYSPKTYEPLELDDSDISQIGVSLQYDPITQTLITYTPPPVDNTAEQMQQIRNAVLDRVIDQNMTEQERNILAKLRDKML